VFSSANALRMYSMEELVGLGVSWVWMGLEGKNSQYGKLKSTNTHKLVADLRANGIRVLGSSIIGLEEHTVDNIDAAIAHAVGHDTDFHQFMLYTPVAGTPLYAQHQAEGTLLGPDEIAFEDTHGQYRFNYRHPHIPAGAETELLLRAFNEDFRVNGPSILRQVRTSLNGWQRHRKHPDARIRRRFGLEMEGVSTIMAGAVWAAKRFFAGNTPLAARLDELLKDLYGEFPLAARLSAPLLGRFFRHKLARETAELAAGKTFEPPTFYERNYVDAAAPVKAGMCQSVGGLPVQAGAGK
jgi:hypothetical protein